jgi:hypothetical protein
MTRRPGSAGTSPSDKEPEPQGGRAAERLRQELESRFPGGVVPEETSAENEEDVRDGAARKDESSTDDDD